MGLGQVGAVAVVDLAAGPRTWTSPQTCTVFIFTAAAAANSLLLFSFHYDNIV